MIEQLKMVNWKSHLNTELRFSPATNILIGSMGSGKTSCLDAICFAFFGTFPSLKSRAVNLSEVIMSRPDKKTSALVEVKFTAGDKNYSVTRTVAPKGTEAFLRCNDVLLEGPQPIRTTEAVSRILKIDYDTFVRVIYGEQNKLDYFLTLPKGARKAQLDDLLGISLFESVRVNSNTLVNKLRSEKTTIESFLSNVNLLALSQELVVIRSTLANTKEKKLTLDNELFILLNEFEITKKNLESLEETRKIHESLSIELVKINAEINSLKSSGDSIMPQSMASLSKAQCTELLEQCSRALQERINVEKQLSELMLQVQRLTGESITVANVLQQFPEEALKQEINQLSVHCSQFDEASRYYLELVKKENELVTNSNNFKKEIEAANREIEKLLVKLSALKTLEMDFGSIAALAAKVAEIQAQALEMEKTIAGKQESISSVEKSLSLLKKEHAVCPTCDQPLSSDSIHLLISQKTSEVEKEKVSLNQIKQILNKTYVDLAVLKKTHAGWSDLVPLLQQLVELKQKTQTNSVQLQVFVPELANASIQVKTSAAKVAELRKQTEKLQSLKQSLVQVEKSKLDLDKIQVQLNALNQEAAKKKLVLDTIDGKAELESKLQNAKSAITAFDLFEKTTSLVNRSIQFKEKLSNIQFDENTLISLRQSTGLMASKLETSKLSTDHLASEIKEKTDLLTKLDAQLSNFEKIGKQSADLERVTQDVVVFQNSVIETQTELRTELIGAVNEAMHEIWTHIYPYRDYASCRITATEDDYLLEVLAGDGWKPIEQCSGGEKTCAALALRVSLAMVLVPNLSWLVLDEPTHNLDSNGVNLLARALHEALPQIVKQTFVVTHDDGLKEGASGTIHVFNRDKDNGEATIVETLA